MGSVTDIKTKGNEYTKRCIASAVALLYIANVNELGKIEDFLNLSYAETLSKLSYLNNDIAVALNISSSIGMNEFLNTIEKYKIDLDSATDNSVIKNMQLIIAANNQKLKGYENVLSRQHGGMTDNALREKEHESTRIFICKTGKSLASQFSDIFTLISQDKNKVRRIYDSEGITFVDKYENTIQRLVDESKHLKEIIGKIDLARDILTVSNYVWRKYCASNIKTLQSLLSNKHYEIEVEIFKSI